MKLFIIHSCELENNPESQFVFIGGFSSIEKAISKLQKNILEYYPDNDQHF